MPQLTRRDFLRATLAGFASVTFQNSPFSTLTPTPPPSPTPTPTPSPTATPFSVATVIKKVSTDQPKIALTYDDLWDDAITLKLAEALYEREIQATFFPSGNAITAHLNRPSDGAKDLYPRLLDLGHEFACHLYTHTNITGKDLRYLTWYEMEPWLEEIQRALGKPYTPVALRPPMGVVTPALLELAVRYQTPLVLWSADLRDTLCTNADCEAEMLTLFEAGLEHGAIALQHTIEPAINILDGQLALLAENGLSNVLLSDLLRLEGVTGGS